MTNDKILNATLAISLVNSSTGFKDLINKFKIWFRLPELLVLLTPSYIAVGLYHYSTIRVSVSKGGQRYESINTWLHNWAVRWASNIRPGTWSDSIKQQYYNHI